MTNIRQSINNLTLDPETVLLEAEGVLSKFGHLTALGRRVQADLIFGGKKGNREDLVAAVNSVYADDEIA